jgi:hypothetical protein
MAYMSDRGGRMKMTPVLSVGEQAVVIGLVRATPHNIFNGTRVTVHSASVLSNGRGKRQSVRYFVTVTDPTASSDGQDAWIDEGMLALTTDADAR